MTRAAHLPCLGLALAAGLLPAQAPRPTRLQPLSLPQNLLGLPLPTSLGPVITQVDIVGGTTLRVHGEYRVRRILKHLPLEIHRASICVS